MEVKSHDVVKIQVFTSKLTSIDNRALLDEINHTDNLIPDDLVTGFGTKTTHTWFEDGLYPWEMPEANRLLDAMLNVVNFVSNKEMQTEEAWTITLEKGQSVVSHSHRANWHMYPNDFFSAAYYVNAPTGSAPLIFEAGYCDIAQNTYSITPETGMLVIFNSFMKHMTGRHAADEKRVVVSANFIPRIQNMEPSPDISPYKINK
jgi:hypothetical protein